MTTGPVRLKPDEDSESGSRRRVESVAAPVAGSAEPGTGGSWLRWALPILLIAASLLISWALFATRDRPVKSEPPILVPLVRVVNVQPENLQLTVVARGTVIPRTESDLVAEVRGRVIEGSPQLVEGGFFAKGDVLLRLDDREYRIAIDRARANVKLRASESQLADAEARRRRELASRGAASAADLDQFESRALVASAALQEARAALAQAELDLERTVLRAPFDGRVRERSVDVGQFVAPGAKLGRIFAVDYAEVRLPVRTDELAFLDAGHDFTGQLSGFEGAPVVLSAQLGGQELKWSARLERAEAAIDPQTRMLNLVARVDDPYGLQPRTGKEDSPVDTDETAQGTDPEQGEALPVGAPTTRPNLPPGLFVKAEISGRTVEDVFVLPMMALRDNDQVFVLDAEDRLRVRDVSVLRRGRDTFVVEDGLEMGERVVISPLRIYSEGMQLRALDGAAS